MKFFPLTQWRYDHDHSRYFLDQKGRRVITIAPDHTLDVVLATLIQNSVGALVVQNRTGDLLGIITERDLMREVYNDADLQAVRVEDVMTRDLVTSHPDSDIEYVMAEMTEGAIPSHADC